MSAEYTAIELEAMGPVRRAELLARNGAGVNYTLAELAARGPGIRERDKALSDAIHHYADIWGKAFVLDVFMKVIGERAKAIVVAEILAAAKRSGKSEAKGLAAGFGDVLNVSGHGVSSCETATVAGI